MNPNEGERHHYELRVTVAGRIRFLSHLEMVDTLLSSLRRAGIQVLLSQGMKPKPLIKLAMPRPVGVEAWNDIVEIELAERRDPDELAFGLVGTLPEGLRLQSVRYIDGRYESAASRVAGATFRVVLRDVAAVELEEAVEAFLAAPTVQVERRTPKRTRTVDVRSVVGEMALVTERAPGEGNDAGAEQAVLRFYTRLTSEGSARPDEVVRALSALARMELRIGRVIRESITLAGRELPGERGIVEPALVGADVPDGPEKPWGAC